jgi:hypothetical protein
MALNNKSLLHDVDCSQVARLTKDDSDEMLRLYEAGYPGNWFDPRMLETRQYFGIRIDNRLARISHSYGLSVYFGEESCLEDRS